MSLHKEHPYVFFDKNDIPQLQKRMEKEPFRERWALFMENADYILTLPPLHGGGKRNDASGRWPMGNAGTSAFAAVVTGQERYALRAKEEALALSRQDLEDWAPLEDFNKGAGLSTAKKTMACALVYDWCYDYLDASEREEIRTAILTKGIEPYFHSLSGSIRGEYSFVTEDRQAWWVNSDTSNWAGVVHGSIGMAGLTLYAEDPRAKEAAEAARPYLIEFLDEVFLVDGGGHEGIMYATYGREWALLFLMAARRFWGDDNTLWERLTEKLAGYWEVYLQGPDGRYANFNDMEESALHRLASSYYAQNKVNPDLRETLEAMRDSAPSGPNSVMSALFEALVPGGDPLLQWAADNGGTRYKWRGASPFYFLWRREDAPSQLHKDRPKLHDAVLFRGAGQVILSMPDLWLAYNGGWNSDRSHYNLDLGSFVLVAGQERLVHDPGYLDVETAHHSTVLVNGNGQRKGGRGAFLRFGSMNRFHYFASDLSEAYEDKSLTKFVRHVVMVHGSYLVILDDLSADTEAAFEWRVQTRHSVDLEPGRAIIKGEQWLLHVLNPVRGQTMDTTEWKTRKSSGPMTTVGIKPADDSRDMCFVNVLYPLRKEDTEVPEIQLLEEGTLQIRKGPQMDDSIRFEKTNGSWVLHSVNDESAESIPDGSERTLERYHEHA